MFKSNVSPDHPSSSLHYSRLFDAVNTTLTELLCMQLTDQEIMATVSRGFLG